MHVSEFLTQFVGADIEVNSILSTKFRSIDPVVSLHRKPGSQTYFFRFNSMARDEFKLASFKFATVYYDRRDELVKIGLFKEHVVGTSRLTQSQDAKGNLSQVSFSCMAAMFAIKDDTDMKSGFTGVYKLDSLETFGTMVALSLSELITYSKFENIHNQKLKSW